MAIHLTANNQYKSQKKMFSLRMFVKDINFVFYTTNNKFIAKIKD